MVVNNIRILVYHCLASLAITFLNHSSLAYRHVEQITPLPHAIYLMTTVTYYFLRFWLKMRHASAKLGNKYFHDCCSTQYKLYKFLGGVYIPIEMVRAPWIQKYQSLINTTENESALFCRRPVGAVYLSGMHSSFFPNTV